MPLLNMAGIFKIQKLRRSIFKIIFQNSNLKIVFPSIQIKKSEFKI